MFVMETEYGILWAIMKVEPEYNNDMNVILPPVLNGELYLPIK